MSKRIDSFVTFGRATDSFLYSDPNNFINDSNTYRVYCFFTAFARKKEIQGGKGIQVFRELVRTNRGGFVNPGHVFTPSPTEGLVKGTLHWARFANHMTWIDEEAEDNEGDPRSQYASLYRTKRVHMATDTVDSLEAAMWAAADNAMEIPIGNTTPGVGTARLPYSIPSLITNDGLAPAAFTTSATVQGVSATTYPNWRNQFKSFSNFDAEIEDILMAMWHKSGWMNPGGPSSQFFEPNTTRDGAVMYTDLASIMALRKILLNRNDRMSMLGERDGELHYINRPFKWAEPLGDETTADASKAIYGVNWDYCRPIVRKNYFMKLMYDKDGKEFKPHNQPDSNIVYEFTDYNIVMESRRRQFKIFAA